MDEGQFLFTFLKPCTAFQVTLASMTAIYLANILFTMSLSMLASLTSWGAFQMNKPLHGQLLKLEEGFEECRKTGVQAMLRLSTEFHLFLRIHVMILKELVNHSDRATCKWCTLSSLGLF